MDIDSLNGPSNLCGMVVGDRLEAFMKSTILVLYSILLSYFLSLSVITFLYLNAYKYEFCILKTTDP